MPPLAAHQQEALVHLCDRLHYRELLLAELQRVAHHCAPSEVLRDELAHQRAVLDHDWSEWWDLMAAVLGGRGHE